MKVISYGDNSILGGNSNNNTMTAGQNKSDHAGNAYDWTCYSNCRHDNYCYCDEDDCDCHCAYD